MMSDTSSRNQSGTRMTPSIADSQVRKGVVKAAAHCTSMAGERVHGDFVVRIPRYQTSVSLTVNARSMAERREIERENEAIRRSGG